MNDPTRESAHEYTQDVHVEMVADRSFQMGNADLGNCDWNFLAQFVWRLSSYSHKHGHSHFGVRLICVVEAINTLPAGSTFSRSRVLGIVMQRNLFVILAVLIVATADVTQSLRIGLPDLLHQLDC
jgi:hypothetical protein